MRWPRRRRLSTRPENVQRRLTNHVTKIVAALVLAGAYYVWNTYIAPALDSGDAQVAQPTTAAITAEPEEKSPSATDHSGAARIAELAHEQRSNEIVTLTAIVKRVLKDDHDGAPHQKFLLELPDGSTLLVAHNTDIAPRVPGLKKGDTVTVRGEYEWDERGGVLHWTHHDPAARHQGGWIEFKGKRYE